MIRGGVLMQTLSRPIAVKYLSTSSTFFQQHQSKTSLGKDVGSQRVAALAFTEENVRMFENNSRLESVRLTADFLKIFSDMSLKPIEQICPNFDLNQRPYQAPPKDIEKMIFDIKPTLPVEDPKKETIVIDEFVRREKIECHRLLRIKKKKMKTHRRKRLWKRMWAIWRKRFSLRFKKKELEFRAGLTEKVNNAKKFDPAAYIKDYLEDLHFELIPKTYKGGRKPQWFVKEMLESDKLKVERMKRNETDLFTKERLIRENETVDDFVKRLKK